MYYGYKPSLLSRILGFFAECPILFLSIIGFILFGLFTLVTFNGILPDYSEGQRTGIVQKISKKGIFFKSYEGTMNFGTNTINGQGQVIANMWYFSVKDPKIAEKIDQAALANKPLTLTYTQYLKKPITLDTDYVVVSVK